MMNHDLIAKLRKILSKTEEAGCTQEEAAAAMAKARRLMEDNEITMAEVADHGGAAEESPDTVAIYEKSRMSRDAVLAAQICNRFFFVRYCQSRRGGLSRIMFFGTPSNIETARWVFTSLMSAFDRLWSEHRRRTGTPGTERMLFCTGVYRGFKEKLEAEREVDNLAREAEMGHGGTSIVLANREKALSREFAHAHPGVRSTTMGGLKGGRSTLESGMAAGRSLNLSRPLGSNGSGGRALPGR